MVAELGNGKYQVTIDGVDDGEEAQESTTGKTQGFEATLVHAMHHLLLLQSLSFHPQACIDPLKCSWQLSGRGSRSQEACIQRLVRIGKVSVTALQSCLPHASMADAICYT